MPQPRLRRGIRESSQDYSRPRALAKRNSPRSATSCTSRTVQDDCWEQRNILFQDLSGYLPDSDIDGPIQLKELVTRKALSESERDPIITKLDVLRVMRTEESRLYPAPSQIELIDKPIARQQEADLVQAIVDAEGQSACCPCLGRCRQIGFLHRHPGCLAEWLRHCGL